MGATEAGLRVPVGHCAEMYHGRPEAEWRRGLEGAGENAARANTVCPIGRGLITGDEGRYASGVLYARAGRIAASGADIVEEITSGSVERLGEAESVETRGAPDAQLAFWEGRVNVARVCRVAVEVTGQVLAGIPPAG